jgi:hypothetical protein
MPRVLLGKRPHYSGESYEQDARSLYSARNPFALELRDLIRPSIRHNELPNESPEELMIFLIRSRPRE